MRRYISVILAMGFIVASCDDPSEYTIKGRITNAEGRFIYLDKLNVTSTECVDSMKVGKNGEFAFKGFVGYPSFFLLRLSEKNFITLLVDSAEHVSVSGDAVNFYCDYLVEGSEGSGLVQQLNSRLSMTKHKLDSIRSLQVSFHGDPHYEMRNQQWEKEYEQVRQDQITASKQFVETHPFSMANVLALYQKFDNDTYVIQDLQSLKIAASALRSFYPKSDHANALYANTLKLMQEERNANLRRFIREHGQDSPDIELPDPDGNNVSLSSLRGKYVLVHFWASVDNGSRVMNPVLVELYNKYHSRGFEIYQVSVDRNRYDWLNAIDEDGLKWINVGDMKGSNTAVITFNVQELPFNYLLDKDGAIVARNLKGPALNRILGQIFG